MDWFWWNLEVTVNGMVTFYLYFMCILHLLLLLEYSTLKLSTPLSIHFSTVVIGVHLYGHSYRAHLHGHLLGVLVS